MKTSLFLLACLSASFIHAQTAIIAHKSHSGTAGSFFTDPNSNFGEPGPQLIQIVRLNDSTYIQVYHEFSGMIYHDTVHKNRKFNHYNKDVDSIYQQAYYRHVEYINVQNKADTGHIKTPSLQLHQMIQNTEMELQQAEPIPEAVPKKKKKNALLFIFLVGGGGLMAFRVLNRLFTRQIAA